MGKKELDYPALVNTGTTAFRMLLFWTLLQNTDEKRNCLDV